MTEKKYPRTAALAAGTVIMLFYGLLYAWSIFSSPFQKEFGWTAAQLGLCFTFVMIFFCLGGIAGSFLTGKLGLMKTILIGGVLDFAGYGLVYFLSGNSIAFLFVLFIISSLGCGIVYNAVVSYVVSLFPDKKGLASGVLLLGFGASTLVFGTIASSIMESAGWRITYVLTAVCLLLVAFFGRIFLNCEKAENKAGTAGGGLTTGEMVKTSTFWIFFFATALLSLFGQGIIGHGKNIAAEGGADAALATLSVGLISVANGLGRIVFGTLYDKKGFSFALTVDAIVYIVAGTVLALSLKSSATAPMLIALILCGLGYGAVPPIASSATRDFFGSDHYPKNFSIMNLNIIIASLGSTIIGKLSASLGSYSSSVWPFVVLEIVPIILIAVLASKRKKAK